MSCQHTKTVRGEDIPRRYGSYRSEVCKDCGKFRRLNHHDEVVGDWQPAEEYASAIEKDEEL